MRTTDASQSVQDQAREMDQVGDLRTCQDCGAWVCYLFTKREWPGYVAACGKFTLASGSCADGYQRREIIEIVGPDRAERDLTKMEAGK
jgi:hypothetical protein